jgi:hypothetical protein
MVVVDVVVVVVVVPLIFRILVRYEKSITSAQVRKYGHAQISIYLLQKISY